MPVKRRVKRKRKSSSLLTSLPYGHFQKFSFRQLAESKNEPCKVGHSNGIKKPRTIFEKCMEKMRRNKAMMQTNPTPKNNKTPTFSHKQSEVPSLALFGPGEETVHEGNCAPLKTTDLRQPKTTQASNKSACTYGFFPNDSELSCTDKGANQNIFEEMRHEKNALNNKLTLNDSIPPWKKVLKRYPARPLVKPIILEHSPPPQANMRFFDVEFFMSGQDSGKEEANNVLFINNEEWMPDKSISEHVNTPARCDRGSDVDCKFQDEDQAYLKNVLISIRSMQEQIDKEDDNQDDEECILDINISSKELSRIINLCLEEKNHKVGLQLLFELLDHEELISSNLTVSQISDLCERLQWELPAVTSGPLLERFNKYI